MSEDPLEEIIADALDAAGVPYERPADGLDFVLRNHWSGVAIECNRYFSPRLPPQIEGVSDVIVVQGMRAARVLAEMIDPPGSNGENERLREALTPSAETKAAYLGEITCDQRYEGDRPHYVPWTTVKRIMKMIRERALGSQEVRD